MKNETLHNLLDELLKETPICLKSQMMVEFILYLIDSEIDNMIIFDDNRNLKKDMSFISKMIEDIRKINLEQDQEWVISNEYNTKTHSHDYKLYKKSDFYDPELLDEIQPKINEILQKD